MESIIILISLTPLILNIEKFIGLRSWEIKKSYKYEDSEGTLTLNTKMSVRNQKSGSGVYSSTFQYGINLELSSTENVQQTDIGSII